MRNITPSYLWVTNMGNYKIIMKRTIGVIAIIILGIIILSGFTTLVKTTNVNSYYTIPKELTERVKYDTQGMDGEQIVKYCVILTAELLSFSQKEDLSKNEANCIGYSRICATLCNYSFKINKIDFRAKHVRGYVSLFSINLCAILRFISPSEYKYFVKDHDFVEIDFNNGKYIFVDPSIYDLTGSMLTTQICSINEKK